MARYFGLVFVVLSVYSCQGQQSVFAWSPSSCASCQTSIFNPGFYSDGSGILVESLQGTHVSVVAGVTLADGNLVVALGAGSDGKQISFNPFDAVTLSTNSGPNMVLYPVKQLRSKPPSGDVLIKKRYKNQTFTIDKGKVSAGYLFFPNDNDATQVTVKVEVDGETFHFPFSRSTVSRAKFVLPDSPESAPNSLNESAKTTITTNGTVATIQASTPNRTELPVDAAPISITREEGPSEVSCVKNISLVSAIGGQVTTAPPASARKWIDKNKSKYPRLCFSQSPMKSVPNLLFVLANSESAFSGIFPTVRSTTATNTAPINGSGTVTNAYGQTWNYTYSGTTTTTTTTTSQVSLPYTDTTHGLYIYVYDQNGGLVSRHTRSITTREGGDEANTFGYNLGSTLGGIHLKDRLIKEAVESVK